MLEKELDFFARNLPAWLEKHAGRVVLVDGDQLLGFFDDEAHAMAEGARKLGLRSFLVRRIEPKEREVTIPALTLGLLNGNSSHPVSIPDDST